MFSTANAVDRIVGLIGPVDSRTGNRGKLVFSNLNTAISFLKICREAREYRKLRDVLANAQVSYASYWRLSHGCKSYGMQLTVWPALRDAMMEADLEVWPIAPTSVLEASGDDIVEHMTVIQQKMILHVPGTPGFAAKIADLAGDAGAEVISVRNGQKLNTTLTLGTRKVKPGTVAFRNLVKRIVSGEFSS